MVTGLSPAQLLPALVREVGALQLRKAQCFFQEQQHFLLQCRRFPSALTDFTERGPPTSLPCCSGHSWDTGCLVLPCGRCIKLSETIVCLI